MKTHLIAFLFLGQVSVLFADWDYKYLTLQELIDQSTFIAIAEIKEVEVKKTETKEEQTVTFVIEVVFKGKAKENSIHYYASRLPVIDEPGISYFIESTPKTKFLLFLQNENGVFHATRGPISVLEINEKNEMQSVYWYTDESKPQRFADHWKPKPLDEVVSLLEERQNQSR